MTVVLKYGKRSVGDLERIENNARHLREQLDGRFRGENLVVTVGAMGDSRDRVEEAIYLSKIKNVADIDISPHHTFQEFENVYKQLGEPEELKKLRDKIYSEFTTYINDPVILKNSDKENKQNGKKRYIVEAMIYLMPDRLSSSLFDYVLRGKYGIDSSFLDFGNNFPLVVKGDIGDELYAIPDLDESRNKANNFSFPSQVVVLPAHGGMDEYGVMCDFGKGGTYPVCFTLGYAFKANEILNLIDTYGIETAKINGKKTGTVKELDIVEAMDAGRYGAKLPSGPALEPLEKMYEEGLYPDVYVAYSQNMDAEKTRIVKETRDNRPVKIISGRDIEVYEIKGPGAMGLTIALYKNKIDPFELAPRNEKNRALAIAEERSKRIARNVIQRFVNTDNERNKVEILGSDEDYSIVGIVGSPMAEKRGVGERAYKVLRRAGINVKYGHHLSDVSIGFVIERGYSKKAQEVLYKEFFEPMYKRIFSFISYPKK